MSKLLHLTGKHGSIIGNYAIVDDEDYDRINKIKWHGHKDHKGKYYAYGSSSQKLHSRNSY